MNPAIAPGWRRWLPRTLRMRLVSILLAGLLLAHALSFALLFYERYTAARAMMLTNLDQDVAVSVALLDRLAPGEREQWLPRLERRTYQYLLRPAQPGMPLATARARQVTDLIDASLQHRYRLTARSVSREPERFEVELRLHDGQPLTIAVTPSMMPLAQWLPVVLAVQLVLLVGCAVVAVRLATRPLARLADAVDNLDPARADAPLPEHGPSEVTRAAIAFNALQARIRSHLTERLQILSAISHDLQTPITRMKLRVETLTEGEVQQRLGADLAQLEQLVREGVAYARSTHAATGPAMRVDLQALLDSVVCDYQDAGKPVRLGVVLDASVQTHLQPLRRIIGNLIDNALCHAGGAEASLRRAPGRVCIEIADRGPGIPEHELETVMLPFHRLEASRNRDTGGTGLGLAIAQQLAASLGAELRLHNRDGGGLVATLSLPD